MAHVVALFKINLCDTSVSSVTSVLKLGALLPTSGASGPRVKAAGVATQPYSHSPFQPHTRQFPRWAL